MYIPTLVIIVIVWFIWKHFSEAEKRERELKDKLREKENIDIKNETKEIMLPRGKEGNMTGEKLRPEEKVKDQPLCYKISLGVHPKWEELLPKIQEEYKQLLDYKIYNDPELEIDQESSLLHKHFSYVIFKDDFSGLTQIWSNYEKTFVDDMELRGQILVGNMSKISEKYKCQTDKLSDYLVITPGYIGYPSKWAPDLSVGAEDMITQIPYSNIIYELRKLQIVYGGVRGVAMHGILKFPESLQKEFDKHQVVYETCAKEDWGTGIGFQGKPATYASSKNIGFVISEDIMRSHVFSNKYYSIWIRIEFFDKWFDKQFEI